MIPKFDVTDWYWKKEDGAVYSSARDAEFPPEDGVYLAWLAEGKLPTPYPKDVNGHESLAELIKVLKPYGLGRYNQIHAELERIDLASVRPLRAIDNGADKPEDHQKLIELERRAAELRAELAGLEAAHE